MMLPTFAAECGLQAHQLLMDICCRCLLSVTQPSNCCRSVADDTRPLHRSIYMLYSISTTPLQVLCGLPLGLGPSASYCIHFFTQSSFRNTCPYHRSLFCCSTSVMSSIPNLSLSSLVGKSVLTPHIHLTILVSLKCHLILFPYKPSLTAMQHTLSHTALEYYV